MVETLEESLKEPQEEVFEETLAPLKISLE